MKGTLNFLALAGVVEVILASWTPIMSFAQPPDTLWTHTYGGFTNDLCYSVQQTQDGGFIMVGSTYHPGWSDDVCLTKTDASGNQTWTRTYGGNSNSNEYGYSVQQTQDGGYIVAGVAYVPGAVGRHFYLIKTNASGDTTWTRIYGGSGYDEAQSVQQTQDGGYIAAGTTFFSSPGNYNVYLIKTDAAGDSLWSRIYGGSGFDWGYSVQQTQDGGYIIAGCTMSFGAGNYDVYLIKTDASGDTLWTRTYGGSNRDEAYSVHQTLDGGYVVSGYTEPFSLGGDFYVIKTDAFGNATWTQTYDRDYADVSYSIQQTLDGGYVVGGTTFNGVRPYDFYLIKTDAVGDTFWTQIFGGPAWDLGHCVRQTQDGGYIFAGTTNSFGAGGGDFYLIRLAAEPPINVTLTPINPSIVIPAYGGSFNYNVSVANVGTSPQTFDAWIMIYLPTGSWYGPVLGPFNLTLPVGVTLSRQRTQNVPASAPAGNYTYRGYVGTYSSVKWDSSSFDFVKLTTGDGLVISGWGNFGESFDPWMTTTQPLLPDVYSLQQNFPNPFNPATSITFQLPVTGQVALGVYDLQGRLVAQLVNGQRAAGVHTVTWDATDFASGLYFCKLEAGSYSQVMKMMLVK